jgi:alkylation response protein AidB-like acyl-CoA dehydrogenase
VDLTLTEEQQLLRDTIREVCEQYSSPADVRVLEDDPVGFRPELWAELAGLGVLGLTVPEELGGSGLGMLEAAIVYEELGRSLCPSPHLVTSVVGAGLLSRAGTPEQRVEWLPGIVGGSLVLTCAWPEPDRGWTVRGVQARATAADGGFEVSGTKVLVPFASSAAGIVTLVRTGDADEDLTLLVVRPDADGVTLTQVPTLGSDASYLVELDRVVVPDADRLGDAGAGWRLWSEALVDAHIAIAAYAVGGAARAHELAVAYAQERVQFDRPIGSFQGVAHPLAESAMEVEGARVLAYEAAWARSSGAPLGPLAAMAKLYACDVFRRTTKVAQQVFGGIGFTRDIDVQLYFRRAKQLEITWEGPRELEDRIAAAELDADRPFVTIDGER